MKLTHILQFNCVKVPLDSTDKQGAITELINLLDAGGMLQNKDVALNAVLTREQTRSTGIGSGVAIPHGKCNAVKELVMALGIAKQSIDFASVDNKPVKLILLLVSPSDQTGPHIQALASISRLMLDDKFKTQLENSNSAKDAYELLCQREKD